MTRAIVIAVLIAAAAGPAAAQGTAYVDEITVYGGVDATEAREFVVTLVERAGLAARFAPAGVVPCGEDAACLADRARARGAAVGVRVTIADVAGEIVVSVVTVHPGRTTVRREIAEGVDLARAEEGLAAALAEHRPAPRRARTAAWSLAGAAVLLGAGGALATWMAYDLRGDFFDAHVDASGDVVGISPAGARAAEERAQRWSLVGTLLLGGAATAGVAATVLFVRDGDRGEARPAGVVIGGRF